jgi:polyisoprenoid-binding protein YceI
MGFVLELVVFYSLKCQRLSALPLAHPVRIFEVKHGAAQASIPSTTLGDVTMRCLCNSPATTMTTALRCWTDPGAIKSVTAVFSCAWLLILLLPGFTLEAQGAQASPDSIVYRIDPSSRLVVKTGKAGLFGFAGHTHVIRARAVSGELVYHRGKPTSYLRLRLPTDSLEVLTPPDTAEIRKVTEAMRTEVLHVDKYPEMTFAADSLSARSGKMEMQLALTMEGTTRKVPVTADVTIDSDSIRARGTFTAKQTDFGIKPYSGGPAGTVKVADRVKFCFDLMAVRGPAKVPGGQPPARANDATTVPGCVDNSKVKADPARRPM